METMDTSSTGANQRSRRFTLGGLLSGRVSVNGIDVSVQSVCRCERNEMILDLASGHVAPSDACKLGDSSHPSIPWARCLDLFEPPGQEQHR